MPLGPVMIATTLPTARASTDQATPGEPPDSKKVSSEIGEGTSPATIPESERQKEIAGLRGSIDEERLYDEPDVPRGASMQEAEQEEDFEVPTLVAQLPTKPVRAATPTEQHRVNSTMCRCCPRASARSRQKELDSLMRHRVVEEVPNDQEGKREDVTQSTPAPLASRLLLAPAACDAAGAEACFAVFLHSIMDECVFVHPRGEGLTKPGFCWRLRRAMEERAGREALRTMSMVFWQPLLRSILAVWGGDLIATRAALDSLERTLCEELECKAIGPDATVHVKLLDRVVV